MPLIRLIEDQINRLRDALLAAFGGPGDIDNLLLSINQNYNWLAIATYNLPQNLVVIIRAAEAEGWILSLVSKAREIVPGDPAFDALERELIPLAPRAATEHFDVCCLSGSHVMVDRSTLRAALRELSEPLGKRILIVKGDPKSGKSHSVQLISYICQARDDFSLVVVDLEAFSRTLGTSTRIEPRDLAQRMVRLMRYDLTIADPPSDAQWSRWVLDFCDDFDACARDDKKQRWLVIDAFNSVLLAQPAFDLIKELAQRINSSLTHFRLVLLGFPESLPAPLMPIVEEEEIKTIGEAELIDFFYRAFTQLEIPFDDLKVGDIVQRVFDQIDPEQSDFLMHLGPLASKELVSAASPGGMP